LTKTILAWSTFSSESRSQISLCILTFVGSQALYDNYVGLFVRPGTRTT